jgi:GH15 family glucan-1,4-alpha-glucosidase
MAWVGADRAVRGVEEHGLDGPVGRWKRLRQDIFDEVCAKGFDSERGTFTQYFGSPSVDAALLLIPKVGFLPASDPRVRGTTAAIERELLHDGFVHRYPAIGTDDGVDAQPHHEGAFLPCTFWLADTHVLQGDVESGRAIYQRLLDLRNDVGLLAEEYDTENHRLVGNFPQALSHLSLVGTALDLADADGPTQRRSAASESRASSA